MKQVEVTLKITFNISDPEAKSYLADKDGNASAQLMADLFDTFEYQDFNPRIQSINDLTQEDIRKKLNEAAGP